MEFRSSSKHQFFDTPSVGDPPTRLRVEVDHLHVN